MKSQTLPWFVINMIGTITFVFILITILTMQKNFYMSVHTLDFQTSKMLFERTLLTSPNCLAYEKVLYVPIGGKNPHLEMQVIYKPGVIDEQKLYNTYNFNCLRYDLKKDGMDTFMYRIRIYDPKSGSFIFDQLSYVRDAVSVLNTSFQGSSVILSALEHYQDLDKYPHQYDVIPLTLYNDSSDSYTHVLLYFYIYYLKGNGQKFCEMKA